MRFRRRSHLLFLLLLLSILGRGTMAWILQTQSLVRQHETALGMGVRGKRVRRQKRKAAKEDTPPRVQTPYGPIRLPRPPRFCDTCRGRGLIRCCVCEGKGAVRATGSRKNNQVDLDRLISSQWTSVEVYYGHRHHAIMELRGSPKQKNDCQIRMRNCCGDQNDFWITVKELRNKMVWRKGWQTLEDIHRANGGPLLDARMCFRCKGERILPCVDCNGVGEIPAYEPLHD